MYARIQNGVVVDTSNNLRREFPNTSFKRGKLPEQYKGWILIEDKPSPPIDQVVDRKTLTVVNGKPVCAFTYRALNNAEQSAAWTAEIAATDSSLPRYAEDIIDSMDTVQRNRLSQTTLDRYNAKIAIRARKP